MLVHRWFPNVDTMLFERQKYCMYVEKTYTQLGYWSLNQNFHTWFRNDVRCIVSIILFGTSVSTRCWNDDIWMLETLKRCYLNVMNVEMMLFECYERWIDVIWMLWTLKRCYLYVRNVEKRFFCMSTER